jgi:6,7-dimethyl-8-ribityllumazine synthase
MGKLFEGTLRGEGLRVGIVVARFNETVTRLLLAGAEQQLRRLGVSEADIDVAWVPGSYELAAAALTLAHTGRYQALICLGCIIRGETSHYEHVAAAASSGIQQVALQTGLPVIFGVLTTENIEQAMERSGTKAGNRGADAAGAAIEMARLFAQITA